MNLKVAARKLAKKLKKTGFSLPVRGSLAKAHMRGQLAKKISKLVGKGKLILLQNVDLCPESCGCDIIQTFTDDKRKAKILIRNNSLSYQLSL